MRNESEGLLVFKTKCSVYKDFFKINSNELLHPRDIVPDISKESQCRIVEC